MIFTHRESWRPLEPFSALGSWVVRLDGLNAACMREREKEREERWRGRGRDRENEEERQRERDETGRR